MYKVLIMFYHLTTMKILNIKKIYKMNGRWHEILGFVFFKTDGRSTY